MQNEEQAYLGQELARTLIQLRRFSGPPGSCQGIRPSEYILLSTLIHYDGAETDGVKVSDLSHRLHITPAGVTHLINSLEEHGLVERLADTSDRRVVLVKATEKSQDIHRAMKEKHMEVFQGLVNYLGAEDSRELLRLLSSTLEYIKEKRQENSNSD